MGRTPSHTTHHIKSTRLEFNCLMIRSIDNQRRKWSEHLVERPIEDGVFDLIFNTERLSVEEMTDQIVNLLTSRKLVG